MKLYRLHRIQCLPISIEQAWDFFSNPQNLPLITPAWLRFCVTSPLPERMYPGMIVTYTITPIGRLPVRWVTEITHVSEPHLFVDEQRWGPYRFWHHQHLFDQIEGGVRMQDIVHYMLPLGPIGTLAHELIVSKRLNEIFEFRRRALEERFGVLPR
ncbi:MAG: SRPBCC family protein [Acidobacteriota bacterium]|nr:SRPBCC family protein [Blastocatellia bacterium]MDW8238941.1 SRPBCC family protein [Acidobacteriota bacterium]